MFTAMVRVLAFVHAERGQGLIEYGAIGLFISIAAIAAVPGIAAGLIDMIETIDNAFP